MYGLQWRPAQISHCKNNIYIFFLTIEWIRLLILKLHNFPSCTIKLCDMSSEIIQSVAFNNYDDFQRRSCP